MGTRGKSGNRGITTVRTQATDNSSLDMNEKWKWQNILPLNRECIVNRI
jgi:hypothetical protein